MNNAPIDMNALALSIGLQQIEILQLRQQIAMMNEHIRSLTEKASGAVTSTAE